MFVVQGLNASYRRDWYGCWASSWSQTGDVGTPELVVPAAGEQLNVSSWRDHSSWEHLHRSCRWCVQIASFCGHQGSSGSQAEDRVSEASEGLGTSGQSGAVGHNPMGLPPGNRARVFVFSKPGNLGWVIP